MTKIIRIENADNSSKKFVVEQWVDQDGLTKLVDSIEFTYPTQLISFTIYPGKSLVIKEI